jgi:hypothetical protein
MHERRAWQAGPAFFYPTYFFFFEPKASEASHQACEIRPGAPLSMPPNGSQYHGGEIPGRWRNRAKTLGYSSAEASIDLSVRFTESRQIRDIVLCSSTSCPFSVAPSLRRRGWVGLRRLLLALRGFQRASAKCCVQTQTSKTHMPGSSSSSPLPLFLLTLSASIGRVQ